MNHKSKRRIAYHTGLARCDPDFLRPHLGKIIGPMVWNGIER